MVAAATCWRRSCLRLLPWQVSPSQFAYVYVRNATEASTCGEPVTVLVQSISNSRRMLSERARYAVTSRAETDGRPGSAAAIVAINAAPKAATITCVNTDYRPNPVRIRSLANRTTSCTGCFN